MLDLNKLTVKDLRTIAKATKKIHRNPITGLNKKQLIDLIKKTSKIQGGSGLIMDTWNKIKGAAGKVLSAVKSALFFSPNRLPGDSIKVFEKYKENNIVSIEIRRDPINSIITTILNLLSKGKFFEKIKQLGYDKVFHLYMILTMDNGDKLLLEKNERINLKKNDPSIKKDTQTMSVSLPNSISLNDFLENTRRSIGDHDFFQYSADNNNCQKFLRSLLQSNNLLNPAADSFIMQDAKEIFSSLPDWMAKFSQFITDTAGKISEYTTGQGKRKRRYKKSRAN